MILFDAPFDSPEENLAADEALLEACEEGELEDLSTGGVLRFWESPQYFVVLGYTGKVHEEADAETCKALGIPILRRTSGGGTVLQGPGCLNSSLVLQINNSSVAGISETNCFVMRRNARALSEVLGAPVELQGYTDLTLHNKKFSGNAQRRRQKFLLFHGTFLLDFDLSQLPRVLRAPPRQPEYRAAREHLDFVTNLHCSAATIKTALGREWGASGVLSSPVRERIESERMTRLVREKYANADWNLKFS
jgi:lipoate-protein ligase A